MSNKDPLQSFLSYLADVKPYHTKIYEVVMSYTYAESIKAIVQDKVHFTITLFNHTGGEGGPGNGGSGNTPIEICDGVGWDTLPWDTGLWDFPDSCVSPDARRIAVTLEEGYKFTITMVQNEDAFTIALDSANGWDVPRWDWSVWDPTIGPLFTTTDVVDDVTQTRITETINFTITEV